MMPDSLRKTLMVWLLGPLLGLFTLGTTIVYQIGLEDLEDAYDRSLYDTASDIYKVAQASVTAEGQWQWQLPDLIREIILSDPYDKVYFSIYDDTDALIAGDGQLPLPTEEDKDDSDPDMATYYDAAVDSEEVRAISVTTDFFGDQERPLRILVGETRHKREMLVGDIVKGFILPQILIVLMAAGVVLWGVRRGLRPLDDLRATLARRSHQDMRPLDTTDVPLEVQPLILGINNLLTRLSSVFNSQKYFIADAAHQLRTPLAGLAAQIDYARSQTNPPQTEHALDSAKTASDRLNHIVSQLLSLARNEAGADKSLAMAPLDLREFARQVTMSWVERAIRSNIDLGFEAADVPVIVMADDTRLQEAVDNLIDNALKYCPAGSEVTVRVTPYTLVVEDNGPGIEPGEREYIFKRFYHRLGGSRDGNGLGLAIVKEIVKAHGATIGVETSATGGALFSITFPDTHKTTDSTGQP